MRSGPNRSDENPLKFSAFLYRLWGPPQKELLKMKLFRELLEFIIISSALFLTLFFIKRHLVPSPIIFYEGIMIIPISIIIMKCIARVAQRDSLNHLFFYKSLIFSLIFFNFNTLIPTMLDRSLSVQILMMAANSSKTINVEDLKNMAQDEYIIKNQGIEKRLHEQLTSHLLIVENKGIKVTRWGGFVSNTIVWLSKLFNIKAA